MLSDEASLIIGLVAHHLSKRAHTPTMTFGFGRLEVLGGLVNSTFLVAICLTIVVEAIERFLNPPEIEQPILFVVVGLVGLITNLVGLFMFHGHEHSDNIRGVFLHVLGDFIGSIGVIATAALHFSPFSAGKRYADPIFSIVIVVILARASADLFLRTAATVVERCPESVKVEKIVTEILAIDGVIAVHDLHVWEFSKGREIAMVHVVVRPKEKAADVLTKIQNLMISHGIYSVTAQVETEENFPGGIDPRSHCAFASSIGGPDRVFVTDPAFRHAVGCPHWNQDRGQGEEIDAVGWVSKCDRSPSE
jgi:cation diffusion facilitator family transporter